jgi:hypothetical protein
MALWGRVNYREDEMRQNEREETGEQGKGGQRLEMKTEMQGQVLCNEIPKDEGLRIDRLEGARAGG